MSSVFEAYKWNSLALIEEFARATARLGVINSCLAIDTIGLDDRMTFNFLKTVLRARLDGHSPPFDRGARVKANTASSTSTTFGDPNLWFKPGTGHDLQEGAICTVHSMHYQPDGTWKVAFREHKADERGTTYFLYDAKHFELVP